MKTVKTIKDITLTLSAVVPNLLLLWKHFSEKKKIDPQVRLIRNKALQRQTKIQSEAIITREKIKAEATLTKLKIEETSIREEIRHLAKTKGIEIGVDLESQKELDFLTSFSQQGKKIIKDKTSGLEELNNKLKVDNLTGLLDKKEPETSKSD